MLNVYSELRRARIIVREINNKGLDAECEGHPINFDRKLNPQQRVQTQTHRVLIRQIRISSRIYLQGFSAYFVCLWQINCIGIRQW